MQYKKCFTAIAITVATLSVFILGVFIGSGVSVSQGKAESILTCIESSSYTEIYADKETGVCYLRALNEFGDAICVMVNADGTPKIYHPK